MHGLYKSIKKSNFEFYKDRFFSLSLNDFRDVETILSLLNEVSPEADPNKAFLLLTGYNMIAKNNFNKNDYLLQNAKRAFPKYRSKKIWQDRFKKYIGKEYISVRLFNYNEDNKRIVFNDFKGLPYNKRNSDYLDCVRNFAWKPFNPKTAKNGQYFYFKKGVEAETEQQYVKIFAEFGDKSDKNLSGPCAAKSKRGKIKVSLEELINTAKGMRGIDDVCFEVMSGNLYKKVRNNSVEETNEIEIDGLTNIVGMVGAGKSTLVKALTVNLCGKGYKLVIVTDTVSDVFKLYNYFKQFRINCSPLIGRSDRIKYINQIAKNGQMYLNYEMSKYLTGACIVDGQNFKDNTGVVLGEEPCFRLRKDDSFTSYLCPYFESCSCTLMQRDANNSDLVITTDAGFAKSKIGSERRLFLETVIDCADLVIFDECDRVQKKFDETFNPDVEFNRFNHANSNDIKKYLEMGTMDRLEDPLHEYRALQLLAPNVLSAVTRATQKDLGDWRKKAMAQTFSSLTLLNDLEEKKEITKSVHNQIYELIIEKDRGSVKSCF